MNGEVHPQNTAVLLFQLKWFLILLDFICILLFMVSVRKHVPEARVKKIIYSNKQSWLFAIARVF